VELDERWIVPGTHIVFIGERDSVEAPPHYVVLDYGDDDRVIVKDNATSPTPVDGYQFAASPVRIVWEVRERRAFAEALAERREREICV